MFINFVSWVRTHETIKYPYLSDDIMAKVAPKKKKKQQGAKKNKDAAPKKKTSNWDRIKELETELSKIKYNKATQHHYGLVRAKIAELKKK